MDTKTTTLIANIQSVLTPDLLTGQYAKQTQRSHTEGHCYAAAEALYHLLGGKEAGYTPCVATFTDNNQRATHWWIKNKNGEIFDPTAEQFTAIGDTPPYHLGKGAGFLTRQPSKRAATILQRLKELNQNQTQNIEINM